MNIKEFIEIYEKSIYWDSDFDKVRIDNQINESLTNSLIFAIKKECSCEEVSDKEVLKALKKTLLLIEKQKEQEEEKLKKQKEKEELERQQKEIDDTFDDSKNDDKPWMNGLECDKYGQIKDSSINYVRIFATHPVFKGKIYFDDILNCECYDGKPFDDVQQSELKVALERELGGSRTKAYAVDAVRSFCSPNHPENHHNPLKETLSKLVWDGEERMEKLFIKVFECDDIPYIHHITKQLFYAWVNRMLYPGCKFDIMFMFEGEQGIGKSELFLRMIELIKGRGVDKMKFNMDRSTLEKVTKYQVCCFDEISDITRVDLDSIKAFISSKQDTYDEKYRSVQTKNRSCILIGSLNPDKKHFLKDITTSFERRFAIIPCHAKGTEKCHEKSSKEWWNKFLPDDYLLQVWAEAFYKVTHEKDFDWMAWDPESLKYAISLQEEYSSLNDDDGFRTKLEDLFSYRYTYDCYYNLDEFKEAVDNARMMCNPTGVELKQIKCGVLHAFIKDILKEPRSPQWIQGMMRVLGWEKIKTSVWLKNQKKNLTLDVYRKK